MRRSRSRLAPVALAVAIVVSGAASAAAIPRGPFVQARMYTKAVQRHFDQTRIEILTSLCRRADPDGTCIPLGDRLRRALRDSLAAQEIQVTWVDEAGSGDAHPFWVFGPIAWGEEDAGFRWRFVDLIEDRCGWGSMAFTWRNERWRIASFAGAYRYGENCP